MSYQSTFKRTEIKYLINQVQKDALLRELEGAFVLDKYGLTTICNIYYDTPNYQLIRTSLEKPLYKEKLRLRSYGVPQTESLSFIEIKKKYDRIVYKRRVDMPYNLALKYLQNEKVYKKSQILQEIDYFKNYYQNLVPAMFISYDRTAYYHTVDKDLRLTFDSNITWRTENVDLRAGVFGNSLLKEGEYVMELKVANAIPLWLSKILNGLKIFPSSYSKYGNAYKSYVSKGVKVC